MMKEDFNVVFPQYKGPKHYKKYKIQPFEFISKNELNPKLIAV